MTKPTHSSSAFLACILAWLVPGSGHFYLGRRMKGLALFLATLSLFLLGVAMQARLKPTFGLEDPLAFLFGLAQMAAGAPYVIARLLSEGLGEVTSPTFEYGNTFTAVSGLLNVLIIFDAFDIARGRK